MIEKMSRYWIWLVLLLALALRLPLLNGSLWLDEAAQALESIRPLNQQLEISYDFQPPLLHLVLHYAQQVSRSEWWLRTVGALIPGLITIWATYKIGEKLKNRSLGLLAALLLATSSFHIFYSQELRPYSLPAMWACLSWLVLLKIDSKKQIRLMVYFSLATLLGLYSSYLYPFLLISQVLYVYLFRQKIFKPLLSTSWIWFVGFIIWLPKLWEQLKVGGMVREQLPGWEKVVSISQYKAILLVLGKFLFGVINIEVTVLFGLISFVFVVFASYLCLQSLEVTPHRKQSFLLLLNWLVIPLLLAWLVSFWIPVVRPKRVLFLLPAMYLFIANLFMFGHKKNGVGRVVSWLLICLTLATNLFSSYSYMSSPILQRENWRQLHQTITTKYPQHNSILVTSFPDSFAPWEWYDDGSYPTVATGKLNIDDVEDLSNQLKVVTDYDYVLVLDYLRDLTDPEDQVLKQIQAFGYQEVGAIEQLNIGFVRIYTKKQAAITQIVL